MNDLTLTLLGSSAQVKELASELTVREQPRKKQFRHLFISISFNLMFADNKRTV